ncbi:DUF4006 family protein [Helicobacter labetoulli]|uniref:DUF4006 family protein n=1 Tax=Helicobacter labetoulli TaxID=2315333 RepID=UPI000EF64BFA|nr:DUF4006 family protein [Helicobacter labetoulli]
MNGLFGINGLTGYFVAVVLLLSVVGVLGTCAILTQKEVATTYYKIEDASAIKQISTDNAKHRINAQ